MIEECPLMKFTPGIEKIDITNKEAVDWIINLSVQLIPRERQIKQ